MRPEITCHREWNAVGQVVIVHARRPCLLDSEGIAADLDNLGTRRLELLVICAEPAHLVRSPASEAGRVEPDNHDLPAKIGKRDAARVAVQREIRSRGAGLKCHMK